MGYSLRVLWYRYASVLSWYGLSWANLLSKSQLGWGKKSFLEIAATSKQMDIYTFKAYRYWESLDCVPNSFLATTSWQRRLPRVLAT